MKEKVMVKTRKTDTNGEDIEAVETGTPPRKDQTAKLPDEHVQSRKQKF
jgi:hypothetical protein